MHPSDLECLVGQAKTGDKLALESLLMAFANELSTHVTGRIPPTLSATLDAEDVMQDTFLQVHLKIERLRECSLPAFRAWLKAIADIALLRQIKKHGRIKRGGQFRRVHGAVDSVTGSIVDLIDKLPAETATASADLAMGEAITALQIGIAGLPPQQRRAVQLHVLEDKSLDETAAELGCTKGAVRALVHRAKHRLAEVMGRASSWLTH